MVTVLWINQMYHGNKLTQEMGEGEKAHHDAYWSTHKWNYNLYITKEENLS